jgi:hypothetical protein
MKRLSLVIHQVENGYIINENHETNYQWVAGSIKDLSMLVVEIAVNCNDRLVKTPTDLAKKKFFQAKPGAMRPDGQ